MPECGYFLFRANRVSRDMLRILGAVLMAWQADKRIRVWINDCHGLVGSGLRSMLEKHCDIEVLTVSGEKQQCMGDYRQYNPDVVIMNMTLKGHCCLDAMRHILQYNKDTCILVISSQTDCITANRMRKAGAKGYISIENSADILVSAVRNLAMGRSYIEPAIAQQLAWSESNGKDNLFDLLTGREFEIFVMLVGDQSLNDIAKSLKLSRSTVANHHTQILKKLGVANQVGLTKLAIRYGIVTA